MAVFKRIFNYETPGPGVDKDAPKSKGIKLFFEVFIDKFWKLIPLSFLYWLFALPVVTIGFSNAGAAYITRNFSRRKPVLLVADYFSAIKRNWKQALAVGLINLLITAALIFGMWFYFMGWNASMLYKIGFVILACMFVMFTFLKYYIYFLLVTFDLKIKQLYRNSLLLSSAGLKENLIITLGLLLVYGILWGLPLLCIIVFENLLVAVLILVFTVLFLPALQSLIIQFCVFPVIKKHMIDPYYEANPDAKKDKSLLNLEDDDNDEETNEEDDDDVIFKDLGSAETIPVDNATESTIPKQYSKRELKNLRKKCIDDDDDTI